MSLRDIGLAICVAVLAAGCALRREARGGEVPIPASRPGNHNQTIQVDGLERSYILHVPEAVSGEALPLVIVLHGTYGTGRKMQIGLGFDRYADERNFYAAYPDAYREPGSRDTARWNDGRDTLESSRLEIDDVAFILAMIDDIGAKLPLDRERVVVTGASNGGMMTYRLGCETDGVFAGIAPVIANIPVPIAQGCTPVGPIDILAINADEDPFIPLEGGEVCEDVRRGCEGGYVLSTGDSLAKFAQANGCAAAPASEARPSLADDGTQIEKLTFSNCAQGARVVAYIVHGGGHTWPPRAPQLPAAGNATMNLDATETIVEFFIP